MDEADSMAFICSIYFFIPLRNTKLLHLLYNWISTYLMSKIKSIAKSIYLNLLINIPEPRVLGHVFLSFSSKLIESHNRICLVMNFS